MVKEGRKEIEREEEKKRKRGREVGDRAVYGLGVSQTQI